ncbi:Transmembrane channel-like protein 4 [Lamellibrachia satsuma]|nr:Transmembrane channel-like protein 4 [Lamellibrachia satsuma]
MGTIILDTSENKENIQNRINMATLIQDMSKIKENIHPRINMATLIQESSENKENIQHRLNMATLIQDTSKIKENIHPGINIVTLIQESSENKENICPKIKENIHPSINMATLIPNMGKNKENIHPRINNATLIQGTNENKENIHPSINNATLIQGTNENKENIHPSINNATLIEGTNGNKENIHPRINNATLIQSTKENIHPRVRADTQLQDTNNTSRTNAASLQIHLERANTLQIHLERANTRYCANVSSQMDAKFSIQWSCDCAGQHGSSTTSYFSVLRWLMFLNLFVAVVIVGAIVLPQVFFKPQVFFQPKNFAVPDLKESELHNEKKDFPNMASNCSRIYIEQIDNRTYQEGITDKVIAVIQGTGWMEKTVLFAGFYFNKTFELNNAEQRSYNMPLAFLFTTAAYFCVTLMLMILYTGDGVKQRVLSAGEKNSMVFNKVFSGWDYSLLQDHSANLKKQDLVKDFKRFVEQIEEKKKRDKVNTKLKYLARTCVNLLVIAFWAGSGYVIYMVITEWTDVLAKEDIVKQQEILALFVKFLPSITITALNIVIPEIFSKMVAVEYLAPDAVVAFTVSRTITDVAISRMISPPAEYAGGMCLQ